MNSLIFFRQENLSPLTIQRNSRFLINNSGYAELKLPEVQHLTDKYGVQNTFLRALETIAKIRETLKNAPPLLQISGSIMVYLSKIYKKGTNLISILFKCEERKRCKSHSFIDHSETSP